MMAVPGLAFGENGPGGNIQGREQRGGPVANAVMGDAF